MMENDKRCAFAKKTISGEYNSCKRLAVGDCDGLNFDCKFYKTKSQLIVENDRKIDRHRKLGRCEGCKYHDKPCRKSDEK